MRSLRHITLALAFIILVPSGCQSTPSGSVPDDTADIGSEETQEPTAEPTPTFPPDKVVVESVTYIDDQSPKHLLDIYFPPGWPAESHYPLVFALHQGGSSRKDMAKLGYGLGPKGFMVVAADHRGYPDNPYPEDIRDIFCAMTWVFENADRYAINPEQIFLVGYSSGGTQAAQIVSFNEPSKYLQECPYTWPEGAVFAGVVTVTGVFDYPYTLETSPLMAEYSAEFLGGSYEDTPDVWEEASAILAIDGDEPPFLLIHGEIDSTIPPEYSELFAQALNDVGVEAEVMIVSGAAHSAILRDPDLIPWIEDFLVGILSK